MAAVSGEVERLAMDPQLRIAARAGTSPAPALQGTNDDRAPMRTIATLTLLLLGGSIRTLGSAPPVDAAAGREETREVQQLSEGTAAADQAPADEDEAADPDPMARMETPEPGARWMTMFHGYVFLTSNRQGGPSGDRDFGSQNHLMVDAMRRWGPGTLSLLGTFTLEPATIPPRGSAELFQRGETYQGVLLVDRQHPHDLFVQLAAQWETDLSASDGGGPSLNLRVYAAPVGEPAVGPAAYTHRLSSSENPLAPLAHHNQDSTHISSDVVTVGLGVGTIATLEGSVFHGREPDENRWDIDQGAIDSYAGRLTLRPMTGLSIQVSAARREHPEDLEPGDQTRQTASAEYHAATPGGFVAAALILGRNRLSEGVEWGNTLEATWKFAEKNFAYGRVENVDRDLYELIHKTARPESLPPQRTAVQALTLGYVRDVALLSEAESGLGAGVTLYRFDSRLDSIYGRGPVSVQGFLRLRFGHHGGADHGMEPMHH